MPKRNRIVIARVIAAYGTLLLGFVFFYVPAGAAPPRSVSLVYFRGESLDNAARLEWRTATENETAGYKIERATDEDGAFVYLESIGFVMSEGSAMSGATYEAIDDSAANGETYWYRLVEVEDDNSETALQTIELTISPEPTSEPISGNDSSGINTPIPTSTRALTSTPEPSATTSNDEPANPSRTPDTSATATTARAATSTPEPTAGATSTRAIGGSDAPASPTPGQNNSGDGIVEAAGPTVVAQVTEEPDSYPSPVTAATGASDSEELVTVESYPPPGNEIEDEEAQDTPPFLGYPGADENGATDGRVIGAGDEQAPGETREQRQQSSGASRVLLWVGFVFALLIFAGGVFFSILLSTRRRHNDLH